MRLLRGGVWVLAALVLAGAGCSKSARKARFLSRANQEFDAGQYDKAEMDYLRVLQFRPPEPLALARLGRIDYDQGKRLQALAFLQEAVKSNPDDLELKIKLGLTFLWFRQIDKAREQALAVLQRQPGNAEALILLADATATPKQLQETTGALDRAASAGTNQAGWHVARATLCWHQADLDCAEAEYRQAVQLDHQSSAAYLGLGNIYLLRQNFKDAEPALKTAAELAPPRSAARLRYAEFKLQTGASAEARANVEQLSRTAPDYVPALGFLAQLSLSDGNTNDCAALIKKILARDPLSYEGLLLNGKLMLAGGNGTNAATQFERVIKAYGPGAQAEYHLAVAQVFNRQDTKAIDSLAHAIAADTNFVDAITLQATLNLRHGNPAAAAAALRRLTAQQTGNPDSHFLLAKAYLAEGKSDDALTVYRRMQSLFPTNSDVPFVMGSLLRVQNKRTEARAAFEKALTLSPDFVPAVEELVDLDLLNNDERSALARAEQQCQRTPKAAVAWLLLAKVHMTKALVAAGAQADIKTNTAALQVSDIPAIHEDLQQAETALRKTIELEPLLPTAYEMLARLYVWSNRQQDAIQAFESFLAKTNDVGILNQLGMIQSQVKNYPAARDAYERALKADPNSFEALNNLAWVQCEHLGQLQSALELGEQARRLAPFSPYAADTLGWICYRRSELPRALTLLREAVAARPNEPEMQYHLGMVLYMRGDEVGARAALQRALQTRQVFSGKTEAAECLSVIGIDVTRTNTAAVLEKRLQQVPNDPIALVRLGELQQHNGAFEKAAANFEAALKLNPQNALAAFRLAGLYERYLPDLERALSFAKQAHESDATDPKIAHLLGRLAFQHKEFTLAASLLQTTASQSNNDPEVLYDLAWAYYSLGQVNEAQTAMKTVAAAIGDSEHGLDAKKFIELVAAAREPGRLANATNQAQSVLAARPDYVPALMVSALALEQGGDYRSASQVYDRVLARFPAFPPATRNLALLYAEHLGDVQRAYDLANQARPSFADDVELTRALGILCYKRGQFARAVQLLEPGAETRPQDGEALCYLGLAYCQTRQSAQGKAALQKAVALSLPSELADQAKSTLSRL